MQEIVDVLDSFKKLCDIVQVLANDVEELKERADKTELDVIKLQNKEKEQKDTTSASGTIEELELTKEDSDSMIDNIVNALKPALINLVESMHFDLHLDSKDFDKFYDAFMAKMEVKMDLGEQSESVSEVDETQVFESMFINFLSYYETLEFVQSKHEGNVTEIDIYNHYKKWLQDNHGQQPISMKMFCFLLEQTCKNQYGKILFQAEFKEGGYTYLVVKLPKNQEDEKPSAQIKPENLDEYLNNNNGQQQQT